jgi:hypothetical protein
VSRLRLDPPPLPEPSSAWHPRCPACGVPMWLVGVQHFADGDPAKDRLHYECKACDAKAVLPSIKD